MLKVYFYSGKIFLQTLPGPAGPPGAKGKTGPKVCTVLLSSSFSI